MENLSYCMQYFCVRILGIYSVATDQAVYEVVLNSIFEVRCIVDAVPPPSSIMWKRRGQDRSILYSRQSSHEPMFGILRKRASLEDDGQWTCDASGAHGGLHADFTVIVLGKYIVLISSNHCIACVLICTHNNYPLLEHKT